MRLIFEYSQADGNIDSRTAKDAFEAVLNTAGLTCELANADGQAVLRVSGNNVDLKNFRIQNMTCDAKLTFETEGLVRYRDMDAESAASLAELKPAQDAAKPAVIKIKRKKDNGQESKS